MLEMNQAHPLDNGRILCIRLTTQMPIQLEDNSHNWRLLMLEVESGVEWVSLMATQAPPLVVLSAILLELKWGDLSPAAVALAMVLGMVLAVASGWRRHR